METLRARLSRKPIVVVPGVYDAFTALVATQAGFETLYVSGAAIAYTRLGRPDIGLVSMSEVAQTIALIKSINGEGIALLLVEQNVVQSLEVAQRAYILDNGRFVLEGSAEEIANNPALKRAYLGM